MTLRFISNLSAEARAELDAYVERKVAEALAQARDGARWLTVTQAADYLGLTSTAIRRRVERGTIPFGRLGSRVLIDREALDIQIERAT